jgi:hypothetical protein
MKKVRNYEMITIIITIMLVIACLFALNELNKVYNIKFEWYSDYKNAFSDQKRDVLRSGKSINQLREGLGFFIIGNKKEYNDNIESLNILKEKVPEDQLDNYIYLFGYLGVYKSQEYDIKFLDISQKQNRVEVLVNLVEPETSDNESASDQLAQIEYDDIIRINKKAFYLYPQIIIVFKNRDGAEIYRTTYNLGQ